MRSLHNVYGIWMELVPPTNNTKKKKKNRKAFTKAGSGAVERSATKQPISCHVYFWISVQMEFSSVVYMLLIPKDLKHVAAYTWRTAVTPLGKDLKTSNWCDYIYMLEIESNAHRLLFIYFFYSLDENWIFFYLFR